MQFSKKLFLRVYFSLYKLILLYHYYYEFKNIYIKNCSDMRKIVIFLMKIFDENNEYKNDRKFPLVTI